MKPPSKSPGDRPSLPVGGGETQTIDLQDIELLVAARHDELAHARSLPPPLPPEIRASHVPVEPMRVSQPPQPPQPPYPQPQPQQMPQPSQAPAAPRSSAFYIIALLVFLVVGVGGGLVAAMTLRKAPAPQAAVITIPVVEVNDDTDGGK